MALQSPLTSATASGREFFDLVKAIGESKSKQEEDRIIAEEVVYLKKAVPQNTNKKKMKELVVRAIYVEMLGQDASFAYMKIVELCASTNIAHKKAGYLAASLCLSTGHEFRLMLVNRIQQDMKSTNQLEACAALSAVCKLVTVDMIPAVLGEVVNLMRHEMDPVRKRAMGAMHRLYQMDKASILDHVDKVRRALCDKDPAVMGASLGLILDLCKDNVAAFKDLVPSLVSILKQIVEHKLPKEFDYHRIPAPWIQMHILRILAVLGRGDQSSSEGMYEVLADVMRRADTGINVGYAIVYEVVNTVTTIYPNPLLLDAAATSISRFIRSDSHNLKYIGIKGLASIVKDHPRYAADHQMAVIDCLEDPDETLKRKTLDLLFRMTNSVNVVFIAEKLLSFLGNATDDYFRTELVGQITQCAERFAPSNSWYVRTMIKVFELAGDKVKTSVAQTLTQLIAEGADASEGDDADDDDDGGGGGEEPGALSKDDQLRSQAVEDFLTLLDKPTLPETLAQTMAWVLGEYGYLSTSFTKERIVDSLCDLAYHTSDHSTVAYLVTAITKLVAQIGSCPIRAMQTVKHFSCSPSFDVSQRCSEFLALLDGHSDTLVDVLPVDASCEDIDVDEGLSFLDEFVQAALAAGAMPYCPPPPVQSDDDDSSSRKESGLKMSPYEMPIMPTAAPALGIMSVASSSNGGGTIGLSSAGAPVGGAFGAANVSPLPALPQGNQLLNSRGVSNVWGRNLAPVTPTVVPSTPNQSNIVPASTPVPGVNNSTSSSSSSSTPPPPTAASTPKGLSEKEKMAAALFGGLSSDPKALAASKRRSAGAVPVATWSSSGATPVATGKTQSATPGNLLGLDLVSPSPIMVPATRIDLLDMIGGGGNDAPSIISAPTQSPPPPPTPSLAEDFSGLTMNTPPVSSPGCGVGTRPLQLTTGDFGQRWLQTPSELKHSLVSPNVRSLELLRNAMPREFAHVESIQNSAEAIFAATNASGGIVLVHVKLQPMKQGVDLTVKSSSRESCASEMTQIIASLTSG